MWELDARLSRDGVVIVSHDHTVTAAGGRRIVLAEHGAAEITSVSLEGGGSVPTLEEVIGLAIEMGSGLYVEIKERAAAFAHRAVSVGERCAVRGVRLLRP
jgi:glycerophosphoryl diester phosphodiesterase